MPSIFSSSWPTRLCGVRCQLFEFCKQVKELLWAETTYVDGPLLLRGFNSGRVHGALILEHLRIEHMVSHLRLSCWRMFTRGGR